MKFRLGSAWYEREIEKEEHLHVTAGGSILEPLLKETRIQRVAVSPRNEEGKALSEFVKLLAEG